MPPPDEPTLGEVDTDLVDRLAALPSLDEVAHEELEWLVAHGQVEVHEAGGVFAAKGIPIERLWVVLAGHAAIRAIVEPIGGVGSCRWPLQSLLP